MTSDIITPRPVRTKKIVLVDPKKKLHQANVLTRGPAPSRHDPLQFDHDMGVSDYRLQVLQELLQDILRELRIHTQHLQLGSDEKVNRGDVE